MNKQVIFLLISLFIILSSDWVNSNIFHLFPTGSRHLILFFTFFFLYLFNKREKMFVVKKQPIFVLGIMFTLILFSIDIRVPFISQALSFFSLFLFFLIFLFGFNTKFTFKTFILLLHTITYLTLIISIQPLISGIIRGEVLRYDFGIFREVGAYGSFMNIGAIMSLTIYSFSSKRLFLILAIFFSGIVFFTVLKKVMISNIFVWIFYVARLSLFSKRSKYLVILFFLIAVGILSTTSFISDNIAENVSYLENVGSESHVRIAMYLTSFKIASTSFPFGSGLATFGSLGSIFGHYSHLYYQYGIDNIGANSEKDVLNGEHTLLDTFWPHIIAELGFIGIFLYLYLYLYPCIILLRFKKYNLKNFEFIFFFVSCLIITSLWEGFTLYTPEIPMFVFINFGLTALAISSLKLNLSFKNK